MSAIFQKSQDGKSVRLVIDHAVDGEEGSSGGVGGGGHTLFVIDYSGSMAGSPWEQVKDAVHNIMANVTKKEKAPDFIIYDQYARNVNPEDLKDIRPRFMTSFKAAFEAISAYIKNRTQPGTPVNVIFMTDGNDTVTKVQKELMLVTQKFQFYIANCGRRVVLHAVGFSGDHNREFLKKIATMGCAPGAYRYAEGAGLDQKFTEIFDFLQTTRRVRIGLPKAESLTDVKIMEADAEIWGNPGAGESSDEQGPGSGPLRLHVDIVIDNPSTGLFNGDSASILVEKKEVILKKQEPDVLFTLRMLENREIVSKEDLDAAQKEISAINPFKCPKAVRIEAMEIRSAVQEKLDEYHTLFAEMSREMMNEDSLAAKLDSLRYEAKFSKARRRRKMEQRAATNVEKINVIEEKLEQLKFDPKKFIGGQMDDMICPLSSSTIADVMEDSIRDIMVFPLRVGRPEHAIDAPSQVAVLDVLTGTYSFETLQQTMDFAIRRHGAEGAHGGFGEMTDSVGMFRGPDGKHMNACLPLYINEDHFARVEAQIEPALAYFFTLDPLGFKGDQYLALFNILGSMILMRNEGKLVGEYFDWLIDDQMKMCLALVPHIMEYLKKGLYASGKIKEDPVICFVRSPFFRTKEMFQNLNVVIAWYLSISKVRNDVDEEKFAIALIEETIRRAFGMHFKTAPHQAILETLEKIVYGPNEEEVAHLVEGEGAIVVQAYGEGASELTEESSTSKIKEKEIKRKNAEAEQFARYKLGDLSHREEKEYVVPDWLETTTIEKGKTGEEATGEMLAAVDIDERKIISLDACSEVVKEWIIREMNGVFDLIKDNYYVAAVMNLLDKKLDSFPEEMRRKIIINALQYYSNDLVNNAVAHDIYKNTVDSDLKELIVKLHEGFERRRKEKVLAENTSEQAFEDAREIVASPTMLSFAGKILKYCPTRGGPIFENVVKILSTGVVGGKTIPKLKEKIRMVLTGYLQIGDKYSPVLSGGQSWVECPVPIAKAFKSMIGEDAFAKIEVAMYGHWGHVYRESDIPNRHGYSNSHPNPSLVYDFHGFGLE